MKTIILVRHAKSSWKNMMLADHDRPLNPRGKQNAPEMGRRLKSRNILPELLLASTAKRAKSTAKMIAKEIGYMDKVMKSKSLFHAGTSEIIKIIQSLDNRFSVVMLFGHNPGFTSCANALTPSMIENIPTCGVVSIEFDIQTWKEIKPGSGNLQFFDYPKKIYPDQ